MKNIIITNIDETDVVLVVSALAGLNISFAVEHSGISAPKISADAPTVESPPAWYDPHPKSLRKVINGKTTEDVIIERLRQKRASAFELRDALVAAGFNKTTYSGVIKRMMDAGTITKSTRYPDDYIMQRSSQTPLAAEPVGGPSIGTES